MARSSTPSDVTPVSLIKATPVLLTGAGAGSVSLLTMIPAMGVSAGLHVLMVVLFAWVLVAGPSKGSEGEGRAPSIAPTKKARMAQAARRASYRSQISFTVSARLPKSRKSCNFCSVGRTCVLLAILVCKSSFFCKDFCPPH